MLLRRATARSDCALSTTKSRTARRTKRKTRSAFVASFTATKLPPPAWKAKDWFTEAKTRAEFLARATQEWTGEADDLDVAHYVSNGRCCTWMELADLATIRDTWTEARYARIREATLGVEAPK